MRVQRVFVLLLLMVHGCAAPDAAQFVEHTSVGLSLDAGESFSAPLVLSLGTTRRVLARVPQRRRGERAGQLEDLLAAVELVPDPAAAKDDVLRLDAVLVSGRAARIALLPEEERIRLWHEGLRLGARDSRVCTGDAIVGGN